MFLLYSSYREHPAINLIEGGTTAMVQALQLKRKPFFFFLFGPLPWHMKVHRLGVKSEL